MQPPPKKLLDQLRDAIRLKHYVYRTEETYVQWIRRYVTLRERTVQELLGHKDVKTTMIYIHVLNWGGRGVRSPLDDNLSQKINNC